MRLPNLNALRMFDAAARHLNFRLAAEELHLTQGAVAQQVRRLEADLGAKLFERQARGLALTDAGRAYHAPVRKAMALIGDATAAVRPENTRVTVSVPPSFAAKWLVPRMTAFARDHPEIEIRTIASERVADLGPGGVDLAIRQGERPSAQDLVVMPLAPLRLWAVASPDYARTVGDVNGPADLARMDRIEDAHPYWDVVLSEKTVAAQSRALSFNQTSLALEAAANGQGVALAPSILVEGDVAAGKLDVLWRDSTDRSGGFYIVHAVSRRPRKASGRVIEWLLDEAGRGAAE